METDSSEIKAIKRVVWRTAVAGRVERFAALLDDPESRRHFGEVFIGQLTVKIDKLFRLLLLLAAIYTVLMLSLLAAQDPKKAEFQILGYSFKNLGYYKEFLLFAAALLTPTSSMVSAYHRYLNELRSVALRAQFPNSNTLEFVSHVFADKYVEPLVKDVKSTNTLPHAITTWLVATFGLVLLGLAIAIVGASFVLQIVVIQDVWSNPSSTTVLNKFIVAFSIGAISLSWLIGVLQFPLPEVDVRAFDKLNELKARDPIKYQETMERIWTESARKERLWSTAAAAAVYVLVYALAVIYAPISAHRGPWFIVGLGLPGLVLAVLMATTITARIKRLIYRSYFRRYPDGADVGLKAFARSTKLVGACRFAAVIVSSVIYSLLALSAS